MECLFVISAKYKRVPFHDEKVAHANLWVEMQTNFVSKSSWASSIETDVLDGFALSLNNASSLLL